MSKAKSTKRPKVIKKQKGPAKKQEICKAFVDRIEKSRTFNPFYQKPQVGCKYWRPHIIGETVEGILGLPLTNFRQSASFPIVLEDGKINEVLANKQLHHLIKQGDVIGQRVQIEYRGRQLITHGHYRKIYRLFKFKDQR